MFEGLYEYAKSTQRMIMLVHMTQAIRRSPCPYVYMTKEEYAEIGGKIPREGETPDPKDAIRITIVRADHG